MRSTDTAKEQVGENKRWWMSQEYPEEKKWTEWKLRGETRPLGRIALIEVSFPTR